MLSSAENDGVGLWGDPKMLLHIAPPPGKINVETFSDLAVCIENLKILSFCL